MLSKDEAAIAEIREQIDRNKQYREYLQGVRQKREDNTTTLAPKSTPDGSSITESGAINLYIEDIIDTKENGLGRPVGQSFVTGVEGDELYPYSINDVEMEEVGEIASHQRPGSRLRQHQGAEPSVCLSVALSNKAIDNACLRPRGIRALQDSEGLGSTSLRRTTLTPNWNGNKGAFSLVTPGHSRQHHRCSDRREVC